MKRLTALRTTLGALGLVVGLVLVTSSASALTLGTTALTTRTATTSAGQPTNDLLCGLWTQGSDQISGQSSIDHPSGASAMGQQYAYTGQNCESEYNGIGGFSTGSGMFTWTVSHSNVNTSTERGTEHGLFALSADANKNAGFTGHITNYDFGTPITTVAPDTCSNREIYYTSGHAYDASGSCSPSGPGNFNTHGGAATGNHYRGNYGTVVYQDQNNMQSPCQAGTSNYCFEATLQGQTN
jgi:hypothetical protein